jgi:Na+(H+)/acetate symporter ActP
MDIKDILLSLIMVASAFVLVYTHLEALDSADPVQIASAVLLIAAMALLMLSISSRVSRLEQELLASQRSMRIGLQGLEGKMDSANSRSMAALEDISKKLYR